VRVARRRLTVTETTALTARFEAARPRLRGVAYRILGSVDDAEDAVQEAWLRLTREDADAVANLDAWLTTVVARICLNTLRARRARHDELVAQVADPVVDAAGEFDPEHQAMLADAVGLALFVVLDTLSPPERLALVLHDVFAVSFEQIAPLVDRSAEATRKLASRARQRIRDADALPDAPISAQREVVDAFFEAGRAGDIDRLIRVLHPDVTLRGDFGPGAVRTVRGASHVAASARNYAAPEREVRAATINGAAGAVIFIAGRPVAVMGFVVCAGRVTAVDVLADAARLRRIDLSAVGG
jgi:RNA polymerase sigma factor (sigma-70 family)